MRKFSNEVNAIREWTETTMNKRCPKISIQQITKEHVKCFADLTSCLPDYVQKYQGQETQKEGPNCWNAVLVFSQILPGFRYTSPEEMNFYLNSPLCQSVAENERKPGDIGVYRNLNEKNEKSEVHAFIYISDRMSFSKRNSSYMNPYEIISSSVDLKRAQNSERNSVKSVELTTQFFRCTTLDNFFQTNQKEFNSTLLNALRQLETQECKQYDFLVGKSAINQTSGIVFEALGKLAKQKIEKPDAIISDKEKFLWQAVLFRSQLGLKQMGDSFFLRSPNTYKMPLYRDRKNQEYEIKSDLLDYIREQHALLIEK